METTIIVVLSLDKQLLLFPSIEINQIINLSINLRNENKNGIIS